MMLAEMLAASVETNMTMPPKMLAHAGQYWNRSAIIQDATPVLAWSAEEPVIPTATARRLGKGIPSTCPKAWSNWRGAILDKSAAFNMMVDQKLTKAFTPMTNERLPWLAPVFVWSSCRFMPPPHSGTATQMATSAKNTMDSGAARCASLSKFPAPAAMHEQVAIATTSRAMSWLPFRYGCQIGAQSRIPGAARAMPDTKASALNQSWKDSHITPTMPRVSAAILAPS
mmetsp:Transcript_56652/g.162576  ORF Transcript_56652/g.162576 Transcript_56652/m.162576 type:complete len:228 (-) Transcript_56652:338-1021(-)